MFFRQLIVYFCQLFVYNLNFHAKIMFFPSVLCQNNASKLEISDVCLHFQLFVYIFSCLIVQLFVYIFSCLFTISSVCLHFQLFDNISSCLFTFNSCLFTFYSCLFTFYSCFVFKFSCLFLCSAVCLHFQCLFTISAVCLHFWLFDNIFSCLFTFSAVSSFGAKIQFFIYLHFRNFAPKMVNSKIGFGAKIQIIEIM